MPRPRKTGLDYFPFDCDFFDDEKIIAVAGEFGIKGEMAAIKLLCAIYRNGYFIEWSEVLKMKMLKKLPGVSAELFDQILNRLVRWGFFDASLFDSVRVLTSAGIQRRYFNIVRRCKKDGVYPHLLVNVAETPVNVAETAVNAAESTQIKGNKIKKSPNGDSKKEGSLPGFEESDPPKKKRAKAVPYRPTLDEVLSYFRDHPLGLKDWDLQARLFFSYYDGLGWKARGTPIERWDSIANHWILNGKGKLKKSHEQPGTDRPNAPSGGVPIRGKVTPSCGLKRADKGGEDSICGGL